MNGAKRDQGRSETVSGSGRTAGDVLGDEPRCASSSTGAAHGRRLVVVHTLVTVLIATSVGCGSSSSSSPNEDLVGDWCGVGTVQRRDGPDHTTHFVLRLRSDGSLEYVESTTHYPVSEQHQYGRWSAQHLEYRYDSGRGSGWLGHLVPDGQRRSLTLVDWNGQPQASGFFAPVPALSRAACAQELSYVAQGFADNARRTTGRRDGPREVDPPVLEGDREHPWAGDFCALGANVNMQNIDDVVRIYPDGRMRQAVGRGVTRQVCSEGRFDPTTMTWSVSGCLYTGQGTARVEAGGRAIVLTYNRNSTGTRYTRLACGDVDAWFLQAVAR